MNDTIVINTYEAGQETEINLLIKKVFDEFIAMDFTEEGVSVFYDFINPESIAEKQCKERTMLTASIDSKIVGVVDTRDNNRVSLLFVDKKYQGRGIARNLFREAMKESLAKDATMNVVYVHASRYSLPVYEKFGFVKNGPMQIENGILYLPMKLTIE